MKPVAFGKLDIGAPKQLGSFEFAYLEKLKYAGFQVSRDPGNPLIWIASGLFIFGVVMVLYFPHRQAWALVIPRRAGAAKYYCGRGLPETSVATRSLAAW